MKAGLIFFVLLLLFSVKLSAQVIYNKGANITLSSGSVVFSRDINNNTGTVSNNGTLTLTNDLLNSAIIGGNGLYNLKGNWTDNGTFNPDASHVIFEGSVADQIITNGASGESFFNLTLKNPNTVYQVSAMGGSLNILNDLQVLAGTLRLHQTTTFLTVNRAATITGILIFNGVTTQTTTIGGDLTGAGTIDMGTADKPHILNLAGAVNQIGTFLSGAGSSLVNYNGSGNQTVFAHMNYRRLIISNSGVKTLQGNSKVNLDLNISGGTFDLGTVPTSLEVLGSTNVAGRLKFNGTTVKTVNLFGNLSGMGSVDMSGGNLEHKMNLNGSLNSIGLYSSGNGATVTYTLNGDQTVFSSNDYRNLTIAGTATKTLLGDVNAKGILTMAAGNVDAASYVLEVSNPAINAINRTSGTVIGKLRRAVGTTSGEYLYPIGSSSSYNPLKVTFHNLNAGPLTAHFRPEPIGLQGLPIDDDGNEIHDTYMNGYWSLSSLNPMSTGSFSLKLNYNGFPIDGSASIIKRTNGGDLTVDGEHGGIADGEILRNILVNGISATSTDFAIGRGRPRITDQPDNIDICETFNAFFDVDARGRGTLSYRWEVNKNDGLGFTLVSNGGVYSNATTDRLIITAAPYGMNGYLYRCVITDGQGHPNTTNIVLLTVNKIPVATATTPDPECPGIAFDNIVLGTSNGVAGTTFAWARTNPAGIETTLPLTGSAISDIIAGTFNNTTDAPISIEFTIVPTGPGTTFCVGSQIYRTVTVNPTPKVLPVVPSTQCDNTATNILLASPSSFTTGFVTFRYTVTVTGDDGDITGFTTPTNNLPDDHHITDVLKNNINTYRTVTYRVVPQSPVGCADGMAINAKVTVNPTPKAEPLNMVPAICYGGTTQIILTTPTSMTTGSVVFDYSVSSTGGGVVTGNMDPVNDAERAHTISRTYNNSSHDLQSVIYSIVPVNNSICPPGPAAIAEVKVHAIPIWDIIQLKPLTCDGGAGLGTIKAILSTGADPYHISWEGPDNYRNEDDFEIENLSSGAYYATVTDNLQCEGQFTSYLVPQYAEPYMFAYPKTPGGGNLTCIGSTDGKIRIAVSSGITAPYSYVLKKESTEVIGTGVFSNLTEYKEFEGLGAGVYTLIITDKYGCERSRKVTLRPPSPMVVTFGKKTYAGLFNISCKGYNDGAVWVEAVSGGRGGYSYSWSKAGGTIPGASNTDRIENLTAGIYTLTVTDVLGCQATFNVDLKEPEGMILADYKISSSADNAFNVSCAGGNDGAVDMTIAGGSGTYSFAWHGPDGFISNSEDISGLKAGSYSCTVTDNNGCILTPVPSFTLTQPAPLQISIVTSISDDGAYQINCFGGTGFINVNVTGGSINNYTYNWSTSDGSGLQQGMQNQSNLKAGTYHLEVKDLNNCIATRDITLTQPEDLDLALLPRHITCESTGFNNGEIDISVSGGAGTISYLWSNGSTEQDISGLAQGVYQVNVTYNSVCSKAGSVKINLPPPLTYSSSFSNYNSYEISCFGMADGSIRVSPTSGKAPFSFVWTGPGGFTSGDSTLTGLKAGTYTMLITDSNLCTASESIIMREPGQLEARLVLSQSIAGGYNMNCAGDSTGTITVNPLNTVNNVDFLWSDGFAGRNRTNLKAGVYTVVITDDNNCQAVSTARLTQPDSLKLKFDANQPFCPDMPDGELSVAVTGGVPGVEYSYRWSDNSTGRTLSNIAMGEYRVIVEDLNRCVVKDSMMLMPENEACLIVPNVISPNGDLVNDYWNIGMKELYPQMEIRIFNRWGETVWRSAKGYPDPWDGRSNGSVLPIDSYHYIIDLHNGRKPLIGNVTIVK